MTTNTHTDDQDLDVSEIVTYRSQSAAAIVPAAGVGDEALVKQSDHLLCSFKKIVHPFQCLFDRRHSTLLFDGPSYRMAGD
jgi:hypothetical protein